MVLGVLNTGWRNWWGLQAALPGLLDRSLLCMCVGLGRGGVEVLSV